jgi:hypothetical protein
MSKQLATNVTVEGTTYKAGSTVPKDVADKIDHPRAWATDDAASSSDSGSTGEDDKGYAGKSPDELKALADERELEVTGTGKDGNVLKGDLVAALEAYDADKA